MGHNYVQSGETYTCTRCGDSYSGHQHTYTETVTEPTCEQDGYTTYTCACGYSYTDNVVPALGHDYVLTGQDETIWTYACTRCGLSYTVVAPIVPEPPVEYSLRNSNVTVTTEHHEYVYASGTLLRETITTTDAEGNTTTETLDFVYDLNGSPYALNYTNGAAATQTYYYITNVQGDVTHLVTTDGTVVAEYGYDAWGKVTAATGTMAEVNPLRYRGYYADAESGFYYLQHRYYDPVICRFINADSYTGTSQGFVGQNMFSYCGNSPILRHDPTGEFGILACCLIGGAISGLISYAKEVIDGYDPNASVFENFVEDVNWGKVAGDTFSGAMSAVPGGSALATAADILLTPAIEQGVNCGVSLLKGEEVTWDWKQYKDGVIENAANAVVDKVLKIGVDVPNGTKQLKKEARTIFGIKGEKRLKKYLNVKQIICIASNCGIGAVRE